MKTPSLRQMAQDVWLLETLRNVQAPGLTLERIQALYRSRWQNSGVMSRTTLFRHRQNLLDLFGIKIESPDKKHYMITNPEQLALDTLANDLLASVQEYLFLDDYRDLGDQIQPAQIWNGLEYLHPIGDALRHKYRLKVRYQKFTDSLPYDAILEPYCLKASLGRWYVLAHKVDSETHHDVYAQCFALDRTLSLSVLPEKFVPNKEIDPSTFFRDAFGIWVEYDKYPVRDMTIEVSASLAKYLRTLPLHHSQKELATDSKTKKVRFQYHISPSPDFIGELNRWGKDVRIIT